MTPPERLREQRPAHRSQRNHLATAVFGVAFPADRLAAFEFSHDGPITVINVFEIPAEQVDKFIAWWRTRAEIMAAAPGFRDARLHRVVSPRARFQLVNVAHWDSKAAHDEASRSGASQDRVRALRENPELRVSANPATYEVVVGLGVS